MYKIYDLDGSERNAITINDIQFTEETNRIRREINDLNKQIAQLNNAYYNLLPKTSLSFSLLEAKDVTGDFIERSIRWRNGKLPVGTPEESITIKTNGWIIYSNRYNSYRTSNNIIPYIEGEMIHEQDTTQMISNTEGYSWTALKIKLNEDKTSLEVVPNDQGYQLVAFMELRNTKKVMRDSNDIESHENHIYAVYKVESDYRVQDARYTGKYRSLPREEQIRILLEGRVLYQPNLPDITEQLRKYGMKRKLKGK
jgi:hypothetical protein